jgi:hypothetical protein
MLQIAREQKPEHSIHVLFTFSSTIQGTHEQQREWIFPKLPGNWQRLVHEDKRIGSSKYRVSFFGNKESKEHATKMLEMFMNALKADKLIESYTLTSEIPSCL